MPQIWSKREWKEGYHYLRDSSVQYKIWREKKAKEEEKQARKLQATLVRNYYRVTDWLTRVKCRSTSVAKKGEADNYFWQFTSIYMYPPPHPSQ